jgi:hypothetical protein
VNDHVRPGRTSPQPTEEVEVSAPTWVTIVAFDTPFLAQLATERLEDEGIASRLLSDSGGETLPHISFATGGYRVQVAPDDAAAARDALVALDEIEVGQIDVGEFADEDGVQPPRMDPVEDDRRAHSSSPLVIAGVIAVIVGVLLVSFGVLVRLL